ncbi:DUF4232 domain-containing protein [Streptomyces sp. NPDC014734]|uniref:DUF4232 domain-containing protein n=1 Tax=Streptomyces sp. NPDC014734 TaxID=3364886 RepID=UPI0036F785AB
MRSNRIRTAVLAATALLASLSLTACTGDEDAAGAAPAASNSAQQSTTTGTDSGTTTGSDDAKDSGDKPNAPAENAAGTSKGSGSGSGSGSGNGSTGNGNGGKSSGGSSADRTPVTCTGDNTKVTVTKVSRPINHLLLTATNTGNRACYAYHAPSLRFDDAQAAFPVLRDSIPQAVVALEPGQSAYAAIGLFGETDGTDLNKSTHLEVFFTGKSNTGSTGSSTKLKLPADTVWGNNGFVTYWQSEMDAALTY